MLWRLPLLLDRNGDSNVTKDTTYFELVEAFHQEGCALCRLSQRAVERYLKGLLYENVNDVTVQETLKATQGFCPAHSELLLRQRNSLGTAILYRAILGHLSRDLTTEATVNWLERLTQQGVREERRIPAPRPVPRLRAARRRGLALSQAPPGPAHGRRTGRDVHGGERLLPSAPAPGDGEA
ncbi:MAG TPA: DUF6062 family protein [Ardenticatenaceae bacterium]